MEIKHCTIGGKWSRIKTMQVTSNYIPLGNSGSLVFLEPVFHSFMQSSAEKRRISFATQFVGKKRDENSIFYKFDIPHSEDLTLDTIQFQFSDPESETSISSIKALSTELTSVLNGKNLIVFYNPEDEERLMEIMYLIRLGSSPFEDDFSETPEKAFGRTRREWKESFIQNSFSIFRQKIDSYPKPNLEIIRYVGNTEENSYSNLDSTNSSKLDSFDPLDKSIDKVSKPETNHIITENQPSIDANKTNASNQTEPNLENSQVSQIESIPSDTSKEIISEKITTPVAVETNQSEINSKTKDEKSTQNISKSEPLNPEVTSVKDSDKPTVSESKTAESIPNKADSTTKFSIQVKMMGMISLIMAVTVSIIIAVATYYFRNDSETRVQENNLALVDIIGLKVSSDIQGIVSKAEQLVKSSSRSIGSNEKNFITDLFFKNDKDFIFIGLYSIKNDLLVNETSFYNEDYLIDIASAEDDVQKAIQISSDSIKKAIAGNPIIINSTQGFTKPSFVLALPANAESQEPKILTIMVRLDKILPAFEKKGIITTFMVNGEGKAIAHPTEDVVQSATSFIDLPIVKEMLTSQVETGLKRFIGSDGKAFMGSYRRLGFGDAGIVSIISEDKAFEAVYNIQARNLYIMGISLCLAMIIVFFFAKSLSRPILTLLSATLEIAKGNFNIGIKPSTRDEVGLLTSYFITMGQGLEEREKVKSILGSMIDPVVVKEAMVDLAALKRGKEAEITAFFSDVASFSTISEQLNSVQLASLLNEYLSAMTILLKENEGVLDKYIGDAIVGIFGAPVAVENHAAKACKASLEMVAKLDELRKYWTAHNLYSKDAQVMDARIGINTGLAKVGFMGTDALASYTMMGDTVNLAARLEAAGKDYGVNVMLAEPTKLLVENDFLIRILDLVRVKGKNEPVRVYELVSGKSSIPQNLADSVGLYEQGFNLYLARNFDGAIAKFQESEKAKGKKDKSSNILITRCQDYKISPPSKDWDGVFTRTTK
jgi:adenylate cyclase